MNHLSRKTRVSNTNEIERSEELDVTAGAERLAPPEEADVGEDGPRWPPSIAEVDLALQLP